MIFALLLFGCSDDGTACQPLLMEPKHYTSQALCEVHEEAALQSDAAVQADFPSVVSRCLQIARVSSVTKQPRNLIPRVSYANPRRSTQPRFGR
jgi:hypothetical protein